jgi:rhodanese-related sulfurtransferase
METKETFSPNLNDSIPEITPEELKMHLGKKAIIDVRSPDEFNGELAHIPGARLATMGPDLEAFFRSHRKDDEIVFVCRSGGRSGQATIQGRAKGFSKCVSLRGGMLLWNDRQYPVERTK